MGRTEAGAWLVSTSTLVGPLILADLLGPRCDSLEGPERVTIRASIVQRSYRVESSSQRPQG